eukprot:scaffold3973_cov161-Amphora_coffeaeformis.AAC.10
MERTLDDRVKEEADQAKACDDRIYIFYNSPPHSLASFCKCLHRKVDIAKARSGLSCIIKSEG